MLNKKAFLMACLLFVSFLLTSSAVAATLGTETGNITISANAPVAALEVFGRNKTNGIAAVLASAKGGKTLYFPHFAANKEWWTGIAVANLSAANATVLTIKAYDTAGNVLFQKSGLRIEAGGQTPFMTIQEIFGANAEGTGWIMLTSSTTEVTAVEMFGSSQGITALTPALTPGWNLYFPHFASTHEWWTGIAVANASGLSNVVEFKAWDESGAQIGKTKRVTIPPYAQMPPQLVSDLFEGTVSGTGWISMESSQRAVGLEIFGQKGGVNGIAGFTVSGELARELYIPHFASDAQWWTGVAFANPGNQAAKVTLTAFNTSGQQIGTSQQVSVKAQAQMQPQTVAQLFAGTVSGTGWIKVTSDRDIAGLELFGRRSDNSLAGLALSGEKGTTLHFPYFVNNSQWWSGIGVANPQTATAAISLVARDKDGKQMGQSVNWNVPGLAQGSPQTVQSLFGLTGGTGSISSNHEALRAMVAMAAAQQEAYADLLAIFSNDFTVPLFDPTVTADASDYDLLQAAIAKVVAAGDAYQQAINYFDQQNALTPTSVAGFSFVRPCGILSSVKDFFWGWAKGNGERSKDRILQIHSQMDPQTRQEMFNVAHDKFGDTVGTNQAEFIQKLQNGELNNQAAQLHSNFTSSPETLDYALYAKDNKMDTTSVAHQEGADGVTKGVDVVVDANTTILNAKFPGFSDGFDKGKDAVENINKLAEDPLGYAADKVKGELEGKASQWLQDKTGISKDLADISAQQASEQVQDLVKHALVQDKTGDEKDQAIKDLNMGYVAPAYNNKDDKSKVEGAVIVPNTDPEGNPLTEDELIFLTILAILDEMEDEQKIPVNPGGYNVQVVGEQNVNQVPNVKVPEDGGVVIAVGDDPPAVTNYALSASASPADPPPGVGVTATAVVMPAKAGLQISFSISGTDGYGNAGTLLTNSQGTASFWIPGGGEGVVDTVRFTLMETGQTVTFSYVF